MAGRGPAPKATRRRANTPERGDWQATEGIGWQHGPVPKPPTGLAKASRDAWATWMQAWFAAHWTPEDLPMLRQVIRLYDVAEGGKASASERSELRQLTDNYGITPKGQQDRRWKAPERKPEPVAAPEHYGHLRAMD